jgi:hypothetical protein
VLDEVVSGPCATACAYGQDWRCVGHVTWPTPVATTTTIVIEAVHDGPTAAPIANAQLAVCASSADNMPCDHPLGECESDDAGYCAMQVPTAQGNSTVLSGATFLGLATAPGYLPTYAYIPEPLSQSTLTFAPGDSTVLFTASETAADYAGALDGGAQTANTGTLLAIVFDCQWHPARGVQVTTEPSVPVYYLSPSLLSWPADAGTSPNGLLTSINVPVGNLTLTTTPIGLGHATGDITVYVNPSAWTAIQYGPQH